MKRAWLSLVMIGIIAIIITTGTRCIKHYSSVIDTHLNNARMYAEKSDMINAQKECINAENEWKKAEKVLRLFVNANDVSNIGLTITTLAHFAKADEEGELLAQISSAKVQLIHLQNVESISNGVS